MDAHLFDDFDGDTGWEQPEYDWINPVGARSPEELYDEQEYITSQLEQSVPDNASGMIDDPEVLAFEDVTGLRITRH